MSALTRADVLCSSREEHPELQAVRGQLEQIGKQQVN